MQSKEGTGSGGFLLRDLTAIQGAGHRHEPFLLVGQIWGGDFPPLPPFHFSITTCPHILGQQLDNH